MCRGRVAPFRCQDVPSSLAEKNPALQYQYGTLEDQGGEGDSVDYSNAYNAEGYVLHRALLNILLGRVATMLSSIAGCWNWWLGQWFDCGIVTRGPLYSTPKSKNRSAR